MNPARTPNSGCGVAAAGPAGDGRTLPRTSSAAKAPVRTMPKRGAATGGSSGCLRESMPRAGKQPCGMAHPGPEVRAGRGLEAWSSRRLQGLGAWADGGSQAGSPEPSELSAEVSETTAQPGRNLRMRRRDSCRSMAARTREELTHLERITYGESRELALIGRVVAFLGPELGGVPFPAHPRRRTDEKQIHPGRGDRDSSVRCSPLCRSVPLRRGRRVAQKSDSGIPHGGCRRTAQSFPESGAKEHPRRCFLSPLGRSPLDELPDPLETRVASSSVRSRESSPAGSEAPCA